MRVGRTVEGKGKRLIHIAARQPLCLDILYKCTKAEIGGMDRDQRVAYCAPTVAEFRLEERLNFSGGAAALRLDLTVEHCQRGVDVARPLSDLPQAFQSAGRRWRRGRGLRGGACIPGA